jgi:hypothetical protein
MALFSSVAIKLNSAEENSNENYYDTHKAGLIPNNGSQINVSARNSSNSN